MRASRALLVVGVLGALVALSCQREPEPGPTAATATVSVPPAAPPSASAPPAPTAVEENPCFTGKETCTGGTICLCCPAGGPHQSCVCSTACKTDADCTNPVRPKCNIGAGSAKGICGAPTLQCCWGCR